MTYAIIVTILLIIMTVLLVVHVSRGATIQEQYQERLSMYSRDHNESAMQIRHLMGSITHSKRESERLREVLAETQERLDDKSDLLRQQRERIKFLRDKNNKLTDELLMVSDLIHVKFTALLPDGQPVKTMFKLGLGPCGLHVKSLRWTELDDRYLIDQLCTNGERKQFVYYKGEVVGRIEFRHGKA